ncbi:acyl carrier protein [Bowmanella yangjiangensis]|uniref:Acyl carrier protein n=1 Tax=Bowmanella yangjiangensis TaxID=2811230 RepID=A0ABS3CV36_9ALTE|nr:phosphopantetheine-binding protein [Bowmanella yangjiangensis]MBN7820394.1 acyl carrier protein [Bowmanella yangjiangensis]
MVAEHVRTIIVSTLQLDEETQFEQDTPLLGAIAEFDSMAIVTLLTTLEENFGFEVDDDEISADVFETFGSLVSFVENKI